MNRRQSMLQADVMECGGTTEACCRQAVWRAGEKAAGTIYNLLLTSTLTLLVGKSGNVANHMTIVCNNKLGTSQNSEDWS